MERSKRDLETLVSSQKEQLSRYEKRLKDVVTAYKGLLKEKEALETSLAAITTANTDASQTASKNDAIADDGTGNEAPNETDSNLNSSESASTGTNELSAVEDKNHLQTQIMTLMNSLATLSAEKSRMEASFQADKKQLRAQLSEKTNNINALQAQMREAEERARANVDEMKAKWIVERQEREKETNNQMLMIRELQKLYADERHLKENIEMQLNNFKTQFASNESENDRIAELQKQLNEAKAQVKQLQTKKKTNTDAEGINESSALLRQVQQEMQQMKDQHAVAIKNEQKRVLLAEDESKKQAELHEGRVANLEARLAELSSTVGSYDRLRQNDQESIQMLKKKIHELECNTNIVSSSSEHMPSDSEKQRRKQRRPSTHDLAEIVDEIVRLKKLLMSENARTTNPIDISKVFSVGADHVECQEDLVRVQQLHETAKAEIVQLREQLQVQKTHISTLQEKVKVLNRNIDEQELELKHQEDRQRQAVKEERTKWKDALAEMENDCRCKVIDMEQQLQKQRQRSLQLLDDKEQEIKTLQTSFNVFNVSGHQPTIPLEYSNSTGLQTNSNGAATSTSDAESNDGGAMTAASTKTRRKSSLKSKKLSVGENCHMLHYANEIARKDIEIAGLRKSKYAAESSLRKAIQEKVTAQEDLCDKIASLEEQIDRLERCKTREGANLEYLKNVIISYIVTKDADGKRHMMNAISAVLQFTPTEIQTINAAFQKK